MSESGAAAILLDDEIHVWSVNLSHAGRSHIASLFALLSDEERWRAERFATRMLAARYVVRRGRLRELLAEYLDQAPASVCILPDEMGKPRLSGSSAVPPLEFSVSSSGDACLMAFARGRSVGIDIEPVRNDVRVADLVRTTFSPGEQERFHQLPASLRSWAFFRGWTQKEAYLKARGCGLSFGAENVEVVIDPRRPPELLAVAGDREEAARWSVADVSPGEMIPAMLVAHGHGWNCRRFACGEPDLVFGSNPSENGGDHQSSIGVNDVPASPSTSGVSLPPDDQPSAVHG